MTVHVSGPIFYQGVCDASGAVAANPSDPDDSRFLVADDEDERAVIRMYDAARGGAPVRELSLPHEKLQLAPDGELDLEAAARLHDLVYWMGSHSRDKKGKQDRNRRRLIATSTSVSRNKIDLRIVGKPYTTLVPDLAAVLAKDDPDFELDPKIPPKDGGLSIEGMAADPHGHDLLLGLRSPVRQGQALVATILNPGEITSDTPEPVQFGPPRWLNLDGLGIRSMEYWPARKCYLVLGGLPGKGFDYRFFTWKPGAHPKPVKQVDFTKMELPEGVAPESFFFLRGTSILVLFDEGNRQVDGTKCKKSHTPGFRSITIDGLS
jgi:hypothetical protein